MSTRLEIQLERWFCQRVQARGGVALKVGLRGWPDRLVLLPGGRAGWVELKRPGGRPSALQLARVQRLQVLGQRAIVAAGYDELENFLASL